MPGIYGTLDIYLRHYRRYSPDALRKIVEEAGFKVDELRYINRPGVLGWWLNSKVLRKKVIPKGQLGAFKLIMPFLRKETGKKLSFGLSLVLLAQKA
jgi:hypothetical protein